MEEIIIFVGFISIVWLFIGTHFYLKLQELKLRPTASSEGDNKDFRDLKEQLRCVLSEIEILKEEQQQLKSLLKNNWRPNNY